MKSIPVYNYFVTSSRRHIKTYASMSRDKLALSTEIVRLRAIHRVYEQLATQLNTQTFLAQLAQIIVDQFKVARAVILVFDSAHVSLEYGSVAPRLIDLYTQTRLEMVLIPSIQADTSFITSLNQGTTAALSGDTVLNTPLAPLQHIIPGQEWLFSPLRFRQQMQGIVALSLLSPLSDEEIDILKGMLEAASALLHNANQHVQARTDSEKALLEMQTFQQIDAELNDTIDLPYVFRMILDWALRFTRADSAVLGLYDEEADALEVLVQYGYDSSQVAVGQILKRDGGVSLRVAQRKRAEMLPDVTMDKDYYPTAPQTRSLISVPILREDRVVAVMTLESNKLNGFTEEHLAFARKLASRAGVSVHNARLFSETQHEKHKLSMILRHIADIVMVLDDDERIVLLNRSAIQVFGLNEQKSYIGESLNSLIPDSPLLPWLSAMGTLTHPKDASLRLNNNRVYNVIVTEHPDIGRIIVLQDVTYFKEMDQLKSELVTTVTHDLKQPLSIMRGYLDLLLMTGSLDDRAKRYVNSLEHSFNMMRQLVDDLLDMARIESGIELTLYPLSLNEIIQSCLTHFTSTLEQRHLSLQVDLPTLPLIEGDSARLMQVFHNLIGNATKYTLPEGHIRIWGEAKPDTVYVHIQDSGIGISAEDQTRIFERFFRVRNSHTAKIEGTGLGLAIVLSLVQAHGGSIYVQSERGKGSTFTVSLPVYKTQPTHQL